MALVNEDIQIIKKTVENENYLNVAVPRKSLRLFLYNIFICIVNRYKKDIGRRIFVINGKTEASRYIQQESYTILYYALVQSNPFYYINIITHVTCVNRLERLKAFFEAFEIIKADKSLKYGYVLDYVLWKKMFSFGQVQDLCGRGHFDRLTTQLSFLTKENHINFVTKQHGLIGDFIKLPNKLFFNKVFVFDENQKRKFIREIVENNDCDYEVEYECRTRFSHTKSQRSMIGIIEQPIKEMHDIIISVQKKHPGDEIHLMLHPLSSINYSKFRNEFFIIESKKKEWDYECIYSGPSTLAYDYLKMGYKGKMFIWDPGAAFGGMDKFYDNLYLYKNFDEFVKGIDD